MRNEAIHAEPFRILLIDDNRNGLLARKSVLSDQGYEVTTYSSPEDALEHLACNRFDLIVTDYRMPRMNGVELIAHVRAVTPAVPIVLVSGMVDVLGLNEKNTGADAVIAKNSSEVQHMVRTVKRLLHRKPPKKSVRAQVARKTTRAKSA
jgi:CheY-like chemotaxis protein